jgi:hypothetical protein
VSQIGDKQPSGRLFPNIAANGPEHMPLLGLGLNCL